MFLKVKDKPFTWSPSALKSYNTCPVSYWNSYGNADYVWKPPGDAQIWGVDAHAAFENAILNGDALLPVRFKVYQKWLDAAYSLGGTLVPEQKKAYDIIGQPLTYFDKRVELRTIIDLTSIRGTEASVIDWKTGKSRYDNDDQVKIGAMTVLRDNPDVEVVYSGYVYLKEDWATQPILVRRDQLLEVDMSFQVRIEPMKHAWRTGEFNPTPNGLCKQYCDCTICPHNGRYDG